MRHTAGLQGCKYLLSGTLKSLPTFFQWLRPKCFATMKSEINQVKLVSSQPHNTQARHAICARRTAQRTFCAWHSVRSPCLELVVGVHCEVKIVNRPCTRTCDTRITTEKKKQQSEKPPMEMRKRTLQDTHKICMRGHNRKELRHRPFPPLAHATLD